MAKRWKHRPEGSNWGDFGEDDQLGRLNLITDARRRAAVAEVREGRCFSLSLPLDLPSQAVAFPFRHPPRLSETFGHNGCFAELFDISGSIDIGADDRVTMDLQYSTQWDALCHIGALFDADGSGTPQRVYYNGFRAGIDVVAASGDAPPAARHLGIETLAETGVQGRGVLVNLHAIHGDAPVKIDNAALQQAIAAQRVEVRPGDILCLYTGCSDAILAGGHALPREAIHSRFAGLDGSDPALLQWITDSGIAAIAADNMAVEQSASVRVGDGRTTLPLHHHCLFKLGLPLGEMWHMGELARWLAAHGRHAFLLTAPPLRLPGAVGSPVTPVATV